MPINEDDENIDFGMTILTPDPCVLMRAKAIQYKKQDESTGHIEYDFWEPLTKWIMKLGWSCSSKTSSKFEQARKKCCTFIEMTIAFQFDTGYNIISHHAPLADQVPYFRAGFAKAIQAGQLVSNTGKKYNSCFAVGSVCAIRSLVGSDAPGVHRRPFLSDETLLHIGKNITLMFDNGGIYKDKPYSIQHFGTTPKKWTPDIILDIQAKVQKRKREIDEAKAAASAEQAQTQPAVEGPFEELQPASETFNDDQSNDQKTDDEEIPMEITGQETPETEHLNEPQQHQQQLQSNDDETFHSNTKNNGDPTMEVTAHIQEPPRQLTNFEKQRKSRYSVLPRIAHAVVPIPATESFNEKRRRLQETVCAPVERTTAMRPQATVPALVELTAGHDGPLVGETVALF